MNDRELLELAAKAARMGAVTGYVEEVSDYDSPHYGGAAIQISHSACTWNPLTDDGDALRLAIRLGIEIIPDREVGNTHTAFLIGRDGHSTWEDWGMDGYEPTRRAVVRAAAEIGKSLP